jgi:hypothetical protein
MSAVDPIAARDLFGDESDIMRLADQLEQDRPRPAAYQPTPIKRRPATKDEMEERARFLIAYAAEHGPVTVRRLYYQAEITGVPGIDKTEREQLRRWADLIAQRAPAP